MGFWENPLLKNPFKNKTLLDNKLTGILSGVSKVRFSRKLWSMFFKLKKMHYDNVISRFIGNSL